MLKSNLPTISIVTPSYNQGEYLEETICSVLDQKYSNLEYIIIDGGSTDKSVEIIKKYQKHLTYWVSEPDKGQSDALNKGLQKCTGDIFNWINSDDTIAQSTLSHVSDYFLRNINLIGLSGKCNICSCDMNVLELRQTEYFQNIEKTIVNKVYNQPATFYSTRAVKYMGGINPSLDYVMDLELWFRLLLKYGIESFKTTDYIFANFRLHDNSKTIEKESCFLIEENGIYRDLLYKLFDQNPLFEIFSENKKYLSANWNLSLINKHCIEKEIIDKEFFEMYKNNYFEAFRYAFLKKLREKSLPYNWNIFRMGLKTFFHI